MTKDILWNVYKEIRQEIDVQFRRNVERCELDTTMSDEMDTLSGTITFYVENLVYHLNSKGRYEQ